MKLSNRIFPRGAFFVVLVFASAANAGTITFETTPAGAPPIDNNELTTAYIIDGVSVEFKMDQGGGPINPRFEAAGDPDSAHGFVNAGLGLKDTANPGLVSQLGDWFIRTPTTGTAATLIITYTSVSGPVTAASGEIWDIDAGPEGTEQWFVEAFDGANQSLGSILSPEGVDLFTPLDGQAWVFSFSGLNDLRRIEISFVGTRTSDIGLAFNNFRPTTAAVPIAPAFFFMAPSLITLLWYGRRSDMARW